MKKANQLFSLLFIIAISFSANLKAQGGSHVFANGWSDDLVVTFHYYDNNNPCVSAGSNTAAVSSYQMHTFPLPPSGHTYYRCDVKLYCGTGGVSSGTIIDDSTPNSCSSSTSTTITAGLCTTNVWVNGGYPTFNVECD